MGTRIGNDANENFIPVHLVGSIPLASADDVFDLLGRTLGNCCRRFPDGETGERKNWIGWQLGGSQDSGLSSNRKQRTAIINSIRLLRFDRITGPMI